MKPRSYARTDRPHARTVLGTHGPSTLAIDHTTALVLANSLTRVNEARAAAGLKPLTFAQLARILMRSAEKLDLSELTTTAA